MRALITGASGFAGTHLAEHLLAEGDEVLGCSLSGRWREDAPPELAERVPLFAWDISRPTADDVRQRVEAFRPEAIYHLAALADPARCGRETPSTAAVAANVLGTAHVMEVTLHLAELPRFLLASSCHVYGPVEAERPVVGEGHVCRPAGGYGKTKWAAEEIVRGAAEERGLVGVVARSFHHGGPRQEPRYMLAEWCRDLARGVSPLVVVNRDSWLDWSDVRDVVRAYRLLVERGRGGFNYNVGCGMARRSGDLLAKLMELAGRPDEPQELSPGRRQEPIAEIEALRAASGWRPEIPPETTLAETLAYWQRREAGN